MDIVLKISDDYTAVTAQILNPSDIEYTEELASSGELKFTIPIIDVQAQYVVEYQKIALYTVSGGADTLIWSGYISEIENDFNTLFVTCFDEKRFLQNKVIINNKDFSAVNVSSMLTTLTGDANGRSGGIKGNLSFTTTLTDTVGKSYTRGTSYYDILNDVAELLGAEWTVSLNEITFETTIGEDKTSGASFVEFASSSTSPNENNISRYRNKRKGSSLATYIQGFDSVSNSEQSNNTATYGYVERSISITGGNVASQTTALINEKSVLQSEIEVGANTDRLEFTNVNIGDLVKIRIERDNVFTDIDTSVKVIKKTVRFINLNPTFSVELASVNKQIISPENVFSDMEKRIKTLEIG